MASSEPLFELSFKRWPPIYRYKKHSTSGQKTLTAEVVTAPAEPTPASNLANLVVHEERNPPNTVAEQEQGNRPVSSSEGLSSVPLMNPYPISFPVPLTELLPPIPSLQPAFPPPFLNGFQQVGPPPSTSSSSSSLSTGLLGDTFQQFGVPSFSSNPFSLNNNFSSMTSVPSGFFSPINSFTPIMGGSLNTAIRGEFPPLHSLPPTFWEPVIRQPESDPTPPMHTPQAPSLQNLASRPDGNGENFSDDSLKAIIIKAQPHHNNESLSHLTREQLVKHVDDLIAWWKQANPQQATRAQQAHMNPLQQQQQHQEQYQQSQQSFAQTRPEQHFRASGIPPLSPAVQAAAESAGAAAKAQEKVIGQCPCCCEAQQNAAFSPCGHLYACTRCAHRVYDGGRGKCPVCRMPIQTYLKIYATS